MNSHASAFRPVPTVEIAIARTRYLTETGPSECHIPEIQPLTSTPRSSRTANSATAPAIQPTILANRRSRDLSPIGLTLLVTASTVLMREPAFRSPSTVADAACSTHRENLGAVA